MIISIEPEIIPYERKVQALCKLPYYGHAHGCPNYGRKQNCPPNQPLIDKVLDLSQETFVIYTKFMVGEFAERMRLMHPEWEQHPRQWYNPRRWQESARKDHRLELKKFLTENTGLTYTSFPEAHGVNLDLLMHRVGIELKWDWPPKHDKNNKVYLISLGGKRFESKR